MIELKDGHIEVKYNGYTGIAYGYSSFSVRDPQGKEIFHTGFTTNEIKTQEEALKYLKDTLVLIGRLTQPQTEEKAPEMSDYEKGMEEAWKIARLLVEPALGGLYEKEKHLIFGFKTSDQILTTMTAQEAKQRYDKYLQHKEQIEVGDEVVFITESQRTVKCVITCIEGSRYGYVDENGHCGAFQGRCFEKTGKTHPGIIHVINELAGRL